MRIAEMETHHSEFIAAERAIRTMVGKREFPAVFSVCEASFPHIAPAIKYRKKREIHPETPELASFRIICKYAPPLFEHAILESLLDFVKSTRVLAKHENDYTQAIERAIEDEEIARSLWSHIEARPGFLQRHIREELGVSRQSAVAMVEIWEELGVIRREEHNRSYRLSFRSQLDQPVEGLCPACGIRGKGPKVAFLKALSCQKCGASGYYHIVNIDRP